MEKNIELETIDAEHLFQVLKLTNSAAKKNNSVYLVDEDFLNKFMSRHRSNMMIKHDRVIIRYCDGVHNYNIEFSADKNLGGQFQIIKADTDNPKYIDAFYMARFQDDLSAINISSKKRGITINNKKI